MKFSIASSLSFVMAFALLTGCGEKGFDAKPSAGTGAQSAGDMASPADQSAEGGPAARSSAADVVKFMIGERSVEQVLCQEGPKVVATANKADFSEQFKIICAGDTTSQVFKDAIRSAYSGTGTPQIKVVESKADENYVTRLSFIYAMKTPLKNPSLFSELKAHDIFAGGIRQDSSELVVGVEARETFPGKRSVEKIVLNYDLNFARGAAIFDKRRTEFNSYILVESSRDVTLSTEHLLDVEQNPNYNLANGFTIGLNGGDGSSYFVFVTDLLIINRIDPKRMQDTLTDLNSQVAVMLNKHMIANAPALNSF